MRYYLRYLIWGALFVAMGQVFAADPFPIPEESSYKATYRDHGRGIFIAPSMMVRPSVAGLYGADLSVGYLWRFIGFDARIRYIKARYAALFRAPSSDEATLTQIQTDPNAEVNRSRTATDVWTMLEYGPGVFVAGKFSPDTLPWLGYRTRFGFSLGSYSDDTHAIQFAPFMVHFDAALQWNIPAGSPFVLDTGLSYNAGSAVATGSGPGNLRRLPLSYLGMQMGVWFVF